MSKVYIYQGKGSVHHDGVDYFHGDLLPSDMCAKSIKRLVKLGNAVLDKAAAPAELSEEDKKAALKVAGVTHVGGGNWELSDGSRHKGVDAAYAALTNPQEESDD